MSEKLILFFRMAIAISFVLLAVVIFIYREYTQLTDVQSYLFSGLLFLYGIFRVYRAYQAAENIYR